MDSIWYIILFIAAVALFLTISAVNAPDVCQKACAANVFTKGIGVSMRNNETCESKFGMTYAKSEYDHVKSPSGFKNACCCETLK